MFYLFITIRYRFSIVATGKIYSFWMDPNFYEKSEWVYNKEFIILGSSNVQAILSSKH